MNIIRTTLFTATAVILISGLMAVAAHATPSTHISFTTDTDEQPVHRLYLVLNEASNLIVLQEDELDQAPTLRRMGNARTVLYKGHSRDVEATVITHGKYSIILDRYMPSDDADD